MGKIFDLDSPVMSFLGRLADLMILNIITIVCCIPIFTIGPAMTALHYVLLKIVRGEDGYIVRSYFKAFKDNFKQGVALGLLQLLIFGFLGFDLMLVFRSETQALFPNWLRIALLIVTGIVFMLSQWVYPLQSHFYNPIKTTLKNAVLMGIAKFPRTLVMTIIWAVPVIMLFLTSASVPILVLFGISAPCLVMAFMYSPVFKQFEPEKEEEEITKDEDFFIDEQVSVAEAAAAKQQMMEELDQTSKASE